MAGDSTAGAITSTAIGFFALDMAADIMAATIPAFASLKPRSARAASTSATDFRLG